MPTYFDQFPIVAYDIRKDSIPNYQAVTNITFRIRFIRDVLANIAAYYEYQIQDGETPEIIADRIYGDATAHWVILLANDIVDAQYDWPLSYRNFNEYIKKRYGTIEWAKTNIKHHEKVIERFNSTTNTTTTINLGIDETQLTNNDMTVPYDTYDDLAEVIAVQTIEVGGDTVRETIYRKAVTYYDYENELNEAKRSIKIIKPEYYVQIIDEFNSITRAGNDNRGIR